MEQGEEDHQDEKHGNAMLLASWCPRNREKDKGRNQGHIFPKHARRMYF